VPVNAILIGEHTSLIRRWKAWERATGPKTPEGKARSAMRGYKGGERQRLRELRKVMREAEVVVKGLQGGSEGP